MKTLLLMRHGKSSWNNAKKDEDKLRPLTKKGEKDAQKMSELLADKKILPPGNFDIDSKADRKTANIFLDQCPGEITFIALDSLYLAEPLDIVGALKMVSDQAERVIVIGHNPGLEGVLQHLTGEVESLPTANIAYLELPIECWSDLTLETKAKKWDKWKPKDA